MRARARARLRLRVGSGLEPPRSTALRRGSPADKLRCGGPRPAAEGGSPAAEEPRRTARTTWSARLSRRSAVIRSMSWPSGGPTCISSCTRRATSMHSRCSVPSTRELAKSSRAGSGSMVGRRLPLLLPTRERSPRPPMTRRSEADGSPRSTSMSSVSIAARLSARRSAA